MSELLDQPHQQPPALKREHDSTDDFEHLEHDLQQRSNGQPAQQPLLDLSAPLPEPHDLAAGLGEAVNLLDTSLPAQAGAAECDLKPVPATPPPSADFEKFEGGARHQAEGDSFASGQRRDELEARIREQLQDAKAATMAFVEGERSPPGFAREFEVRSELDLEPKHRSSALDEARDFANDSDDEEQTEPERSEPSEIAAPYLQQHQQQQQQQQQRVDSKQDNNLLHDDEDDDPFAHDDAPVRKEPDFDFGRDDVLENIKSSTLPEPEKSPELDFVKDEIIVHEATKEKPKEELWNVLDKSDQDRFQERDMLHDEPPTKPLPPLPKGAEQDVFEDFGYQNKYDMSNDFLMAESKSKGQQSGGETGDSEFESEPEPSPAKTAPKPAPVRQELGDAAERKFYCQKPEKNRYIDEIAPKEIFKHIGLGFEKEISRSQGNNTPRAPLIVYSSKPSEG